MLPPSEGPAEWDPLQVTWFPERGHAPQKEGKTALPCTQLEPGDRPWLLEPLSGLCAGVQVL